MRFLKNLGEDKKRLIENFISLSILQGANYLLPLITFPYLVKVLGPEKFGLIMFTQAFVQYFNILTDFGFNLSATQEIAIHRNDKKKLSETFNAVMSIKIVLLILSFIIMSIIIFSFDRFQKYWFIYYLAFGTVIGQTFFPIWFFQGVEKMKYITLTEIYIKLLFFISIFFFIHNEKDYWKVLLLYSISALMGGIFSLIIIRKRFHIVYYIPNLKILNYYFTKSIHLFFSQVSISFFNQTNTFLGGLFFNYTLIGYYNAAEKVFTAFRSLFGIMFRVFYPFFIRQNSKVFSLYIKMAIIISILFSFILYISSEYIVEFLYGKNFTLTTLILRILSIGLFLSGVNILIYTLQFLIKGCNKAYFLNTTIGGFFNIILLILLSKLTSLGILSIPISVVLTELFLLIGYIILLNYSYECSK